MPTTAVANHVDASSRNLVENCRGGRSDEWSDSENLSLGAITALLLLCSALCCLSARGRPARRRRHVCHDHVSAGVPILLRVLAPGDDERLVHGHAHNSLDQPRNGGRIARPDCPRFHRRRDRLRERPVAVLVRGPNAVGDVGAGIAVKYYKPNELPVLSTYLEYAVDPPA